jgi:glycosyltransferase involved in cell wall biosynthesis
VPSKSDLHVLIPAFNEEASIETVILALKSLAYERIIVVDDGSSDETALRAQRLGCIVLSHPINLGVGAAIRTGLRYAELNGVTEIVQIDADGQHSPSSIVNLLDKSNCDLVIGCRDWDEYKFGIFRRGAQKALKVSLSLNGVPNISDPTSGFRLYRKNAIVVLAERMPSNFLGDTIESLIIASQFGLRIDSADAEIHVRYAGKPSHHGFKIVKAFITALTYSLTHLLQRQKHANSK